MLSPEGIRLGSVLVSSAVLVCCAAANPTGPDPGDVGAASAALRATLAREGPPPAGAIRVRLAFPARADLDLFVTDPAHETVYFANTPSRSGGFLERDVRCSDPAPRIETVVFPAAPAGRYRVGVDYPRWCGGHEDAVPFVVAVDGGGVDETVASVAKPAIFLPVVLEVDSAGR